MESVGIFFMMSMQSPQYIAYESAIVCLYTVDSYSVFSFEIN